MTAQDAFVNSTHTWPRRNFTGSPSFVVNVVPSVAFGRFHRTS